ncbi:hypothetical protein [Nocardia lasii]|uniref:Uncharacterized protein n=1 Tax=Nocardia lasii TaxID=1616107 RepID=A0ABW1JS01_9NOCA
MSPPRWRSTLRGCFAFLVIGCALSSTDPGPRGPSWEQADTQRVDLPALRATGQQLSLARATEHLPAADPVARPPTDLINSAHHDLADLHLHSPVPHPALVGTALTDPATHPTWTFWRAATASPRPDFTTIAGLGGG